MATKAISNEKIIAALLQHGTIKEAAKAAGTSPRTIYDRMTNDDEFRDLYYDARTEMLRGAVYNINKRLAEAINTVAEIMSNSEINPAIRLQAAQIIIKGAAKFDERLTEDEAASISRKQWSAAKL